MFYKQVEYLLLLRLEAITSAVNPWFSSVSLVDILRRSWRYVDDALWSYEKAMWNLSTLGKRVDERRTDYKSSQENAVVFCYYPSQGLS